MTQIHVTWLIRQLSKTGSVFGPFRTESSSQLADLAVSFWTGPKIDRFLNHSGQNLLLNWRIWQFHFGTVQIAWQHTTNKQTNNRQTNIKNLRALHHRPQGAIIFKRGVTKTAYPLWVNFPNCPPVGGRTKYFKRYFLLFSHRPKTLKFMQKTKHFEQSCLEPDPELSRVRSTVPP